MFGARQVLRRLRNRVVTCHSIKRIDTLCTTNSRLFCPLTQWVPIPPRQSAALSHLARRDLTRSATDCAPNARPASPVPARRVATCRRRSGPSPRYPRYPSGLTPTGTPRCAVSSTTRDALIRDVRSSSRRTQQYLLGREASRPERKAPSKRAPFHQVGGERGQGATSFLATTTRRQGYAARGS